VQAGGVPGSEGRRLHHQQRNHALPTAGLRALPEAPGRRSAHGLYETEATGHRTARLQCGTGAHIARFGRHSAGRQSLQVALLQGLRCPLQGLHHGQVRIRKQLGVFRYNFKASLPFHRSVIEIFV